MLDMFRRPGDPDEHHGLYAIPAAALVGGCLAGQLAGAAARGRRGGAPGLFAAGAGCGPSEAAGCRRSRRPLVPLFYLLQQLADKVLDGHALAPSLTLNLLGNRHLQRRQ
jgi:hypothetical protein